MYTHDRVDGKECLVSHYVMAIKWMRKVYKGVVPLVIAHGLQVVALTIQQEMEHELADVQMLYLLGGITVTSITRLDKTRNEYMKGNAQVGRFGDKVRESKLLRLFSESELQKLFRVSRPLRTFRESRLRRLFRE